MVLAYFKILKIDGFVDAVVRFFFCNSSQVFSRNGSDEGLDDTEHCFYTMHYHVKDRKSIDNYLENFAPKMRQEVTV